MTENIFIFYNSLNRLTLNFIPYNNPVLDISFISRVLLLTLIITSVGIVLSKHTLHALFYLILTFFNSALLLILLKIEFFGLIFLIIYLGAITILFIFIVMMLNLRLMEFSYNLIKYLPVGALLTIIMLIELVLLFKNEIVDINLNTVTINSIDWVSVLTFGSTIKSLGLLLYLYYFILFINASIILLIGMVGAITLTLYFNNTLNPISENKDQRQY